MGKQQGVACSHGNHHLLVDRYAVQPATVLRALHSHADHPHISQLVDVSGTRQQNCVPREHRLHRRLQVCALLRRQIPPAFLGARLLQHSPELVVVMSFRLT